jgi:hypothetical protein
LNPGLNVTKIRNLSQVSWFDTSFSFFGSAVAGTDMLITVDVTVGSRERPSLDARELSAAFARIATNVAVVTVADDEGGYGCTANV